MPLQIKSIATRVFSTSISFSRYLVGLYCVVSIGILIRAFGACQGISCPFGTGLLKANAIVSYWVYERVHS